MTVTMVDTKESNEAALKFAIILASTAIANMEDTLRILDREDAGGDGVIFEIMNSINIATQHRNTLEGMLAQEMLNDGF